MTLASRFLGATAVALALATALTATARPAHAQNTVEAEVLFQEGKRLLKAGQTAAACDKFEASERLESSTGTLLNAADCREKNRQFATAWGLFLKAAASAQRFGNDASREGEARRRAAALAGRLSFLTVSVPDSSKVDGLTILRRGQTVDPALWNQGVPVDIGEYEIAAQAPGHEPWLTRVTVSAEGQRAVVEVPRFKRLEDLAEPARSPLPSTAAPGANDDARAPAAAPREARPSWFTTRRKLGLGLGVLGVVALGVGTAAGLEASDLRDQADALCPDAACSDPRAVALNDDAQGQALRANVLFIAGGAAVTGAVVLWVLGKPPAAVADEELAVRPSLTPGSLGFSVTGRF